VQIRRLSRRTAFLKSLGDFTALALLAPCKPTIERSARHCSARCRPAIPIRMPENPVSPDKYFCLSRVQALVIEERTISSPKEPASDRDRGETPWH
jgi:hypothetical protein